MTSVGVVLKTPRLSLEPVTDGDIAVLVRHFSEAQMHRYLHDEQPLTYEHVNAIATTSEHDFKSSGYGIWTIHLVESGAAVGLCGLRGMLAGGVELLFWVRPRHWNLGYARESAAAVLEYALGVLGLPRVFAACEPENRAAAVILTRLGMLPVDGVRAASRMSQFVISRDVDRQVRPEGSAAESVITPPDCSV